MTFDLGHVEESADRDVGQLYDMVEAILEELDLWWCDHCQTVHGDQIGEGTTMGGLGAGAVVGP